MKVVYTWQPSEETVELCHTFNRLYVNVAFVVLHFKSTYEAREFFFNTWYNTLLLVFWDSKNLDFLNGVIG